MKGQPFFCERKNMKRKSGILMHPSTLWGEYSIGSFGRAGYEFIDFLCECGFSVWQTLPFCMTDEFNSPYKSPASFSYNPYFIDLPTLNELGYISDSELCGARQSGEYRCEFERLNKERVPLLLKAARTALSDTRVREKSLSFASLNPRISAVAEFLSKGRTDLYEEWCFLHYEFYREWQALKGYANERGIEIAGDVPIYVCEGSSDVWEEPENFLLDENGYPTSVAGVPPDYFSTEGQLWGNPIYNYAYMQRSGFSWWRERIRSAFSLFDILRIDHFRGFESYYSIPKGKSARSGEWKRGPGAALVSAIVEESRGRMLIAEDLGVIDSSVRALTDKFSLPGMRVFEFAFLDGGESEHLPHNYINNSVAYTGTHDNNTLLGYLFECSAEERGRIFDYCGYGGSDIDGALPYIIRTMAASSAGTVIFPIQDILGHGSDTRMNTPSVASGNWGYRITRGQLDSVDRKAIYHLFKTYGRI